MSDHDEVDQVLVDEHVLELLASDGAHDWAVHLEVFGDAGDVIARAELTPGEPVRLPGSTVRVVTGGVIPTAAAAAAAEPEGGGQQ